MTTTRQEHLEWCKQRALQYVEAGDCKQALASFLSDVGKHPETNDVRRLVAVIGMPLLLAGHLDTPQKMREHITGYN